MIYLGIDLTATKTNMLQSLGVLAPAPVMPAVMLAHALDHHLAQPLGIHGVGLVHHHADPWIERLDTKRGYLDPLLVQRRGACLFDKEDIASGAGAGPQQNALQPMALADIEWTLLLACERSASSLAAIREMLLRMRLAGGQIHSVRVHAYPTWDETIAQTLRRGFWIEDATDLLTDAEDPIAAALAAADTRDHGWIVPANLGYALLETPRTRQGARDGRNHAFAEPMIGLVRFVSAAACRARDRALSPQDLWRYGWDDDQFLITNRQGLSLQPHLNS